MVWTNFAQPAAALPLPPVAPVLKLAATGHRPDKLGGYDNEQAFTRLTDLAAAYLRRACEQHPGLTIECISGMALGWDMAWAVAALKLRNKEFLPVTLTCAVPFRSQPDAWVRNPKAQNLYRAIIQAADRVEYLYPNPRNKGEAGKYLNDRNRWMVNEADVVVSLWNGDHPTTNGIKSGTGNCVADAQKAGKSVTNLWPAFVKHSGLAL